MLGQLEDLLKICFYIKEIHTLTAKLWPLLGLLKTLYIEAQNGYLKVKVT